MRPDRRALLAAPFLALAPAARAQGFPSRPVRIVVPLPPGGAVDITARLLAERLPVFLGQPVIVENRGGAGGNIGAEAVARAEPDGHTILLGTVTLLAANRFLYARSMPIEPLRDLAPLTRAATGTVLLVVNANRPWRSFAELLAAARAAPGRITMGSSGIGAVSHLTLATLNRAAGVDITHVPYRGGGPAIADLVAGNIDMMFDVIPALMPHVREGRFRPLAVGSAERVTYVPELGDVPGMAEVLPGSGIDMQSWYAFAAPARTPPAALSALHAAILSAVDEPGFAERLRPLGFTPIRDASPEAFGAFWRAEEARWQAIVQASGATLE
jgi:tripartite-type tricarboxylate transporter receptor subunit TctC